LGVIERDEAVVFINADRENSVTSTRLECASLSYVVPVAQVSAVTNDGVPNRRHRRPMPRLERFERGAVANGPLTYEVESFLQSMR